MVRRLNLSNSEVAALSVPLPVFRESCSLIAHLKQPLQNLILKSAGVPVLTDSQQQQIQQQVREAAKRKQHLEVKRLTQMLRVEVTFE
jgi:hypothetical protein